MNDFDQYLMVFPASPGQSATNRHASILRNHMDWSDRLQQDAEAFAVPLRMGDGFDDEAYERLTATLRGAAKAMAGAEAIPRRVASVLVQLQPGIESSLVLYRDEPTLAKIREAIANVSDLVISCVDV